MLEDFLEICKHERTPGGAWDRVDLDVSMASPA